MSDHNEAMRPSACNVVLGGWWFGALDDRTQPLQAVRVDLGPEVRR